MCRMSRWQIRAVSGVLVAWLVLACGGAAPASSPAASPRQELHIVVSGHDVLFGAPVHAGPVWFVLDAPPGGAYTFIQSKSSTGATEGPLSADDVARLARGDTQGMSIGGFGGGGCTPEQREAARGLTGPCGNVYGPVTLAAGKYVFMTGDVGDPTGRPGVPMSVLEVLP
jgi:hypothetical protein